MLLLSLPLSSCKSVKDSVQSASIDSLHFSNVSDFSLEADSIYFYQVLESVVITDSDTVIKKHKNKTIYYKPALTQHEEIKKDIVSVDSATHHPQPQTNAKKEAGLNWFPLAVFAVVLFCIVALVIRKRN